MSLSAITADAIFDGTTLSRGCTLLVCEGVIVDVVPRLDVPAGIPVTDHGAGMITPGLVDVQVNGGGGVLLNDTPSAAGVRAIAEAHRRFGTTALLPTVITDSADVMERAIAAVADARQHGAAGVVGIHLEGPFIDPVRRGAHPAEHIRRPTAADIERLCRLASRKPQDCGTVLVTLAPNIVPIADVARLASAGVVVSLGHADATNAEAQAALAAGVRGFTHLFNAMSQLGHRAPGMVGAALANGTAYCGLIADGHHVDPTAMRIALAAKGPQRIVLISDAMPTAAGGPDRFQLQGREVRRDGTRLTLADGTLAGATITLADAIAYVTGTLGVSFADALTMAITAPAMLIGQPQLARLPGQRLADLLLWPPAGIPKFVA